jgi:hypothetical protein
MDSGWRRICPRVQHLFTSLLYTHREIPQADTTGEGVFTIWISVLSRFAIECYIERIRKLGPSTGYARWQQMRQSDRERGIDTRGQRTCTRAWLRLRGSISEKLRQCRKGFLRCRSLLATSETAVIPHFRSKRDTHVRQRRHTNSTARSTIWTRQEGKKREKGQGVLHHPMKPSENMFQAGETSQLDVAWSGVRAAGHSLTLSWIFSWSWSWSRNCHPATPRAHLAAIQNTKRRKSSTMAYSPYPYSYHQL